MGEGCAITFKLPDARFINSSFFFFFPFSVGGSKNNFVSRVRDSGFRENILQLHKKNRVAYISSSSNSTSIYGPRYLCLSFLSVKQTLRRITLLMSFLLWQCMVLLILSSLLKILHGGGCLCKTEPSLSFILWNITKFPCYLVQKYCSPI